MARVDGGCTIACANVIGDDGLGLLDFYVILMPSAILVASLLSVEISR